MFCTACGGPLGVDARFCISCGAPVAGGGAPAAPSAPYAGFWLRCAAYLIDSMILGIPGVLVWTFFLVGALTARERLHELAPLAALAAGIGLILLQWMYCTLLESSSRQATLGKMAAGLVVTDLAGRRISFGRANARFWAKLLSGMTLYVGFLMAAFTEKRQALHDMIAGCVVVKRQAQS